MRAFAKAAAALSLAVVLVGCTAHRGGALVTSAVGRTDRAREPAPPSLSLETYIEQVRTLSAHARPPVASATTIESRDPVLNAALVAATIAPTAPHLRQVGDEYRRVNVLDVAAAYYQRALRLDPRDALAYDGLARVWRDWGALEVALAHASRAVYYAPTSSVAYNTLGTVMQAIGKRRDARAAYEQALRLDPQASYALINLCYVSFLDGQPDLAIDRCRQALAIEPQSRAARNNLGLIYAALGRLDLARAEMSHGADAATTDFNMGVIHMARREYADAAAAFESAVDVSPSFVDAFRRARQARELAR